MALRYRDDYKKWVYHKEADLGKISIEVKVACMDAF
jgi:hypothetical protein